MNLYQTVSSILDRVFHTNKGTFKTAIYDTLTKRGVPSSHYGRVYKLVSGVMQQNEKLDALICHLKKKQLITPGLLKNESYFKILVYETFYGEKSQSKIRIGGLVARLVKQLKGEIGNFLQVSKMENENKPEKKFFRVLVRSDKAFFQILKVLSSDLEPSLEIKPSTEPPIPRGVWLTGEQMKGLKSAGYELHKSRMIVAQTASSCLPAAILKESFSFDSTSTQNDSPFVIDTCAAPGNKTLQLIEYFYPRKVAAFDKDPKRFALLESRLKNFTKSSNWQAQNKNFLEVSHEDYPNVKAILLDPSCSGTGMLLTKSQYPGRGAIKSQGNEEAYEKDLQAFYLSLSIEEQSKVKSLTGLQTSLIRHAMGFGSVETIVYSTCSILVQENEEVVERVLGSPEGTQFKLVEIHEKFWKRRGLKNRVNGNGAKCLRADPETDKTDGFFVALFQKNK